MDKATLAAGCRALRLACSRHGANSRENGLSTGARIEVEEPVSESDLCEIESALGYQLPLSYRKMVLTVTSGVTVDWVLPDTVKPPVEVDIDWGDFRWSLASLIDMETLRRRWTEQCFTNPGDPYDAIWYGKLGFLEAPNGDMHAIDLVSPGGAVVYLSHDDGEGHGYTLGHDFEDYMDRMLSLGFPGPEEWKLTPFIESPKSGLVPGSKNGALWRGWFGLP